MFALHRFQGGGADVRRVLAEGHGAMPGDTNVALLFVLVKETRSGERTIRTSRARISGR